MVRLRGRGYLWCPNLPLWERTNHTLGMRLQVREAGQAYVDYPKVNCVVTNYYYLTIITAVIVRTV